MGRKTFSPFVSILFSLSDTFRKNVRNTFEICLTQMPQYALLYFRVQFLCPEMTPSF